MGKALQMKRFFCFNADSPSGRKLKIQTFEFLETSKV